MATADRRYELACQCFSKGDFENARSLIDSILKDTLNSSTAVGPEVFHLGAVVAWNLKEHPAALDYAARAVNCDPENVQYRYNLGTMHLSVGHVQEASTCFREVLQRKSDHTGALNNLASALVYSGQLTECIDCCRKAIALGAAGKEVYTTLGNALRESGAFEEAMDAFRHAVSLDQSYANAWSALLLTMNYAGAFTNTDIFNEHKRWGGRFRNNKPDRTHLQRENRRTPLRVGYVSGDFHDHSVSCFFEPLLENHDPARVMAFCYYNGYVMDATTSRLMKHAAGFRAIFGQSDAQCAGIIAGDRIDILVDLSGHTAGNRLSLFAARAAPHQMTWLGYPNTTGLDAMDYRLTDARADPDGMDAFYTERQIRLPGGFLCYRAPDRAPPPADPPCLTNGYVTFGSFNNRAKITAAVIETWSRILAGVPGSRLLLKCRQLADERIRSGIINAFSRNGIEPSRLDLLQAVDKKTSHLSLYRTMDIALDTFPYNGTTTTCEALWMGVPVVTCTGDRHSSRVGFSLLGRLGLNALAPVSIDRYIGTACLLANDPGRLTSLHRGLRTIVANSPLCDAKRFTKEVEEVFIQIATQG